MARAAAGGAGADLPALRLRPGRSWARILRMSDGTPAWSRRRGAVAHARSDDRGGIAGEPAADADATRLQWAGLMAAAQAGDANSYRRLLAELVPWLRRYYARRLPAAMVEDTLQDVLLAVHEKRHTFDPSRPFGPWLAAIARYKWIDRLRSLRAEPFEPLDDSIGRPGHEDAVVADVTSSNLLARLKPAQAEAIRLVKLQGFSVEEASEVTGQSVSLVKVNVHRGLQRPMSLVGRSRHAN